MAKNRHTFAKRQRELDKKRKADEKRARRQNQDPSAGEACDDNPESSDSSATPDSITSTNG